MPLHLPLPFQTRREVLRDAFPDFRARLESASPHTGRTTGFAEDYLALGWLAGEVHALQVTPSGEQLCQMLHTRRLRRAGRPA